MAGGDAGISIDRDRDLQLMAMAQAQAEAEAGAATHEPTDDELNMEMETKAAQDMANVPGAIAHGVMEAPGKAASAMGGLYNAVRHPVDTATSLASRNTPYVPEILPTASEGALAAAGGILGAVGGPPGIAGGAALGGYVGRKINQAIGTRPGPDPAAGISGEIQGLTGDALANMIIAKGGQMGGAVVRGSMRNATAKADMASNPTTRGYRDAGAMGFDRNSPTATEMALADQVAKDWPTAADTGFLQGGTRIDPTTKAVVPDGHVPQNLHELHNNAVAIKNDIGAQTQTAVRDFDHAAEAYNKTHETAARIHGPRFDDLLTGDIRTKIKQLRETPFSEATGNALSNMLNRVEGSMETLGEGITPWKQNTYMKFFDHIPGPGELSVEQMQNWLQRMNQAERAMKAFDTSVQAQGIQMNPSVRARLDANVQLIDALRPKFQSHLSRVTNEVLSRIDEIPGGSIDGQIAQRIKSYTPDQIGGLNELYGAFSTADRGLARAKATAGANFNQPSPQSLQLRTSLKGNLYSAIPSAVTGAAENAGILAGPEVKYAQQSGKVMGILNNSQDVASGASTGLGPMQQAAVTAGTAMQNPGVGVAAAQIGRSSSQLMGSSGDPNQVYAALSQMGVDSGLLAQTAQAAELGRPEEVSRGMAAIAASNPAAAQQVFGPPQVPGIHSMVDGVVYDPTEKQFAKHQLSDLFQDDSYSRMLSHRALNAEQPLPDFAIRALGGEVPDNNSFVDKFVQEQEGGQQLGGYRPAVKGSGVTIGTGVDLGQRGVEDLRTEGIPESLIAKLSPYLGKVDARADTVLKLHPLALNKEEADALDKLSIGKIRSQVTDAYESATGGKVEALPQEAQAVIMSLAQNLGPALEKAIPTGWKAIVEGDWKALQEFLVKTKWKQPELESRRLREAQLLTPLIPPDPAQFAYADSSLSQVAGRVNVGGGVSRTNYKT